MVKRAQDYNQIFELWDLDTNNLIGTYPTLEKIVKAAYGLGQMNDPNTFPVSGITARTAPGWIFKKRKL